MKYLQVKTFLKQIIILILFSFTFSSCYKTVDEYCAYCVDASNELVYLFTICDYDKIIQKEIAEYEQLTGKKTKCKFVKQ